MSLSNHLDLLATAPDGIKCLRGLILELAVRGKLVPQNPDDEPASELLKRIEVEKARLVKEGKIRKPKALEAVGEDEQRPPFPGGDATARNRISPPYPGFNPRPPFPGGDAQDGSLRALVNVFQSAPPVSGRRCSGKTTLGEQAAVSIRAPRFREAMPWRPLDNTGRPRFQSAPPVSGRRCTANRPTNGAIRSFQSAPPVSGRRCSSSSPDSRRLACFNPRPPFPGGDALTVSGYVRHIIVSIRAPRFREAMPDPQIDHRRFLWFQSAPPVSGRRCPPHVGRSLPSSKFQSAPPVSGRRCLLVYWRWISWRGFNPRPPFPGGDAL